MLRGTCAATDTNPLQSTTVRLCLSDAQPDPGGTTAPSRSVDTGPHEFAEWPMPDALPGSKVAPSFSTAGRVVIDNVTHLNWQRDLPETYDGCTGQSDPDAGVAGDGCSWEQAIAYCRNLDRSMGSTGWRLPTRIELFDAKAYCAALELHGGGWRMPAAKELMTLVDVSRWPVQIDPEAFPNTTIDRADLFDSHASHFWSASPGRPGDRVWLIDFKAGGPAGGASSETARVRCVR